MPLKFLLFLGFAAVARGGCPFASSQTPLSAAFQPNGTDPEPTGAWEGQIPAAGNTSDPFVAANNLFHTFYEGSGVSVRPHPIIMQEGDYLVLFHAGRRSRAAVIDKQYHDLKMVCHFVLGTFMVPLPELLGAAPAAKRLLSTETLGKLAQWRGAVSAAQADLQAHPGRFEAGEQLHRQQAIIAATLGMLGDALSTKWLSVAGMDNFTRGLMPMITQNFNEAAERQANLTFAAMEAWRLGELASVWDDVKVVLTPSHMARRANSAAQFMSRYFNVDIIQSDRFITIESIKSEAAAMTLLDTHVTDYFIGDSFFHDHWRMHQDALCGAAHLALNKLFPDSANTTSGCLPDPPNP